MLFQSLLFLARLLAGSWALRFLNISVPEAVSAGESVWLVCDFDLEGEDLYSVKWYKNHVEFYRYQPRDTPPGQTYKLNGTMVDLERSNSSHVFLSSTDLSSEGLYGCEVSGEAPSYSTAKAQDELRIYALPSTGPAIDGLKSRYIVGDEVNLTCAFGPSKPVATVNWFINGRVAQAHHVTHLPPRKANGLQWITMRLLFPLSTVFLRKERLRLVCLAEVYLTYASAYNELIIGERLSGPGPQNEPTVIPSRKRPRVNGAATRYDVGDVVDINCTSTHESSPPVLKWFINNHEVPRRHLISYSSSVLGLRFEAQQHHIQQGELRLKCESSLVKRIVERKQEVTLEGRQETAELQVASTVPPNAASISSDVVVSIVCGIWSLQNLIKILWTINVT